jgi:uncharacterized protein YrrD
MLGEMDLGTPISYLVLAKGTPVYSSDGQQVGKVTHVLAAEDEDVFEGIVIGEHVFGTGHRFVEASDVEEIHEHGVLLTLGREQCERLPEPSANPAVMRADPAESRSDIRHEKLRRAWGLISGND